MKVLSRGRKALLPHCGHFTGPFSCWLIVKVSVTSRSHLSQWYSYTGMIPLLLPPRAPRVARRPLPGHVRVGENEGEVGPHGTADSAESFIRVDQILPARGLFAIDGDLLDPQRLGERDFLRVGARERGLDLGRDPLSQLLRSLESNFLQEGGEQPAANTPSHAEGAVELGRPAVQSAVDVYLLVRCGPITAVFLRRLVRCRLHGGED